jgi:phospholipid/cholesterol/gamma-HCH transport system permease protein
MLAMTKVAAENNLSLQDDTLNVRLSGSWRLSRGLRDFYTDLNADASLTRARRIQFEVDDLGQWDSSLIVYLQQVADHAEASGIEIDQNSLPITLRSLLSLARAVPETETGGEEKRSGSFERVGRLTVEKMEHFGTFLHFSGTSMLALLQILVHTKRVRWRELWPVAKKTGPGAVGLVALIAFMIGAILAFLGFYVLAQFGASIYVVYIVGYGVLREMGPLMTAIIIAGRTGAAYAAEIGSMKASEELDAYETMGIDPIDMVVIPRLLALFFMMPLLTVYADAIGVFGGMIVSVLLSDLTIELFIDKFVSDINLFQFVIGIVKGTIFGVLVGLAGCLRGLQSGKSAEAVGQATTSAVVTGITLIIGCNFLIDFVITMMGL